MGRVAMRGAGRGDSVGSFTASMKSMISLTHQQRPSKVSNRRGQGGLHAGVVSAQIEETFDEDNSPNIPIPGYCTVTVLDD